MERFYLKLIVLTLFVIAPLSAVAQMDIDDITLDEMNAVRFVDSVRVQQLSVVDYYSHARYKYERRKLRYERNKIQITSALGGINKPLEVVDRNIGR